MCKITLMLACLVCAVRSRRMQSFARDSSNQPLAEQDIGVALALQLLAHNEGAAFNPSTSGRRVLLAEQIRARSAKAPRAAVYAKTVSPPVRPKSVDNSNFTDFVGTLMQVASKTAEAASVAAEQWVNTGWQLKKRPGQLIPEIRPNKANDAKALAHSEGMPAPVPVFDGKSESATRLSKSVDSTVTSLLASDGATKLQSEFVLFLSPREGKSYRTTQEGEIVFASQQALSTLVTEFSYGKLKEVAAATRAIARYVEDLEGELEIADDEVVNLRMEVKKGAVAMSETKRVNDKLQAEADELSSKLSSAQQELETRRMAISEMEKAAERTAEQLLNLKKAGNAAGKATKDEVTAKALRLEQELMEAETATSDLTESKLRLEESIATLSEQKQQVEEARRQEAERVKELEQKALTAEAKSEQMAHTLSASEAQVASLEAQLDQLKRAIDVSGTPMDGTLAEDASDFRSQAVELSKQIGSQLGDTGLVSDAKRPALSKMKRDELIRECEERKMDATGTVAELRATLRVERKRESLTLDLVERGWSEEQARNALEAEDWNLDAAIKRLTSQ
mmetsp:Transcript_73221/g.129847  ORF Transcript_73221/g.129847 Transcript_73221/m.129847 type:complete len:567 (-) Transcript_73221:112-1812(-)